MTDEEMDYHAKGYEAGQSDLYEWVNNTVSEWYQLGITNDKQHIAMLMLLHEVDRKVNYEFKG